VNNDHEKALARTENILTRPPPPGSFALRFSSRESVAAREQKKHFGASVVVTLHSG
jgi:hypothetical protein